MAEKLCTLRTKGGGGGGTTMTETVLWQNPSPSSSFSAQAVTLSDDIDNYDYIGLTYKYVNSDSTNTSTNIISVADFKKGSYNAGVARCSMALGITNTSNTNYFRTVLYVSNTSIRFTAAASAGDSYIIPLQVVGIKVALPPSVGNVKTGSFANTSGVNITVDCGFRPKQIYIYNMESSSKIYSHIYDSDISTTYTIGAYRTSNGNDCARYTIGQNNNGVLQSVTDTGFTFKGSGSGFSTLYYTAIG